VFCNISFKEHLPEEGHSRWPKHVAGYVEYKIINLHICMVKVKVDVTFTLEQTTKAQKGSRGIGVLIL